MGTSQILYTVSKITQVHQFKFREDAVAFMQKAVEMSVTMSAKMAFHRRKLDWPFVVTIVTEKVA